MFFFSLSLSSFFLIPFSRCHHFASPWLPFHSPVNSLRRTIFSLPVVDDIYKSGNDSGEKQK